MRQEQKSKIVIMRAPMSLSGRATDTSESCDTQGFNDALVVMARGTGASLPQEVYIQESDNGSKWTTIAEAEVGNAACVGIGGTVIALSDFGENETVMFHIDLRKRRRYLNVFIENSAGAFDWSVCALLAEPSNLVNITSTVLVSSEGSGTEAYCRVPV